MTDQENRESGHRQRDHTADLALEIWGPSEAEMLCEAMRAMVDLLTEGAPIEAEKTRDVVLSALDPADRLVRWMSEILYLATVEGFLAASADVQLTSDGLRARITGTAARDRLRTEIKGVTYHDLTVHHGAGRVTATVVLDV